jgi:hypothetical protein
VLGGGKELELLVVEAEKIAALKLYDNNIEKDISLQEMKKYQASSMCLCVYLCACVCLCVCVCVRVDVCYLHENLCD